MRAHFGGFTYLKIQNSDIFLSYVNPSLFPKSPFYEHPVPVTCIHSISIVKGALVLALRTIQIHVK